MGNGNLRTLSRTLRKTIESLKRIKHQWLIICKMCCYIESVNSSSQQNTAYGMIILQEAGKQLALMAALFSMKLIVEKLRRAVWEKKIFSGSSNCMQAYFTLETFSSFSTEALDQPSICSVLLRRWVYRLYLQSECVKKCQSQPCSKYDRENNFCIILW